MKTKIFRVADQVFVPAEINKFSQKNLDDFETFWRSRIQLELENEIYWNWLNKNRLYISRVDTPQPEGVRIPDSARQLTR